MDHIQRLSEVFVEMASLVRPQLWINRELVAAADDDAATNEQQQRERSSQSAAGFLTNTFSFVFLSQYFVRRRFYPGWGQPSAHCGGGAGVGRRRRR